MAGYVPDGGSVLATERADRLLTDDKHDKKKADTLRAAWNDGPNKDIALRNASTSPLLLLLPEVRNRIYGYGLGGNVLHVEWASDDDEDPGKMEMYISQHQQIDIAHLPRCELLRDREKSEGVKWEVAKHYYCTHEGYGDIYTASLLLVSRQIHFECALMAYSLNTFMFPTCSIDVLPHFLDSLSKIQKWALRRIFLHAQVSRDLLAIDCLREVTNLSELTVSITCGPHPWHNTYQYLSFDALKELPLQRVTVRLAYTEHSIHPETSTKIVKWTEDVEKMLTRGTQHAEEDLTLDSNALE